MRRFRNREEAGRMLADRLAPLAAEHPVVVGLPRGGVPVAFEIARALDAPLDVIVVRKLGVPFQPELGMGAIGEGGVRVLDDDLIRRARIAPDEVAAVEARERAEVERRARRLRPSGAAVPLSGRTVIIVDDGIATGGTARAALRVARAHGARRVVLAVPVASPETLRALAGEADAIVCLEQPALFAAVGEWYADFSPVPEERVVELLAASRVLDGEVVVQVGQVALAGDLSVPRDASGVVVFAHGSGSSRHSPRNRYVARLLNEGGLATLLLDLLTGDEAVERRNVFDIELLARRLAGAVAWVRTQPSTAALPIGLFGASTGAAAALRAAVQAPHDVAAVVSRGGRPDLAGDSLSAVPAPTLLIVGGRDDVVLELNRKAAEQLTCEHRLVVVPGATHLFEEPGTLELAAELARTWFIRHLMTAGRKVPIRT